MKYTIMTALLLAAMIGAAYAADDGQAPQEQKAQGLDMVSDTVASAFAKANALISGNLEVTMSKDEDKAAVADQFERNAIGQKVPKKTAVKSQGSLHNDQPL